MKLSSNKAVYVINGKFLGERITGMQRYALEIVAELDKIAEPGKLLIVAPKGAGKIPEYKNIQVVRLAGKSGIPWEQIALPIWLNRHHLPCANLLAVVPIFHPQGLVVAHGVNYKVNPQFFVTPRDKASRLWHIIDWAVLYRCTQKIVTDTEFSKSEIMKTYHIHPARIHVIGCAWQHMQRISESTDTFARYPQIAPGKYYFSMSSVNVNKNFKWIVLAAQRNPESQFAIAGGRSLKAYLHRLGIRQPDNLHFLGYVSDGDAKTLMAHCKAFLFPTYYEGFGIPPMEAMACGAQAIVSDTPTMHEVYRDTVHYINPDDPNVDLDALLSEPVAPASETLSRYSWAGSARALYDLMVERER